MFIYNQYKYYLYLWLVVLGLGEGSYEGLLAGWYQRKLFYFSG